ncbi:MAG: DUF5362 family protein [Verrucomicrobiota bacterium]
MSIDPYSSPSVNVPPVNYSAEGMVTQGVLQQLAGTKPWVRFMSVLMFVGAGFMLLIALVMLLAGGAIASSGKAGGLPAGATAGIAILYALLSVVYIYPALKLWGYANKIAALLVSGSMLDLEGALSQQRSFWKFIGILVIAMFVLYFVAIIALVAFGGLAAMKAQGV